MIFARFSLAITLFKEFFYFRMSAVISAFLLYLIIDSTESAIALQTGPWNKFQKALEVSTGTAMLLAVAGGIAFRLPLYAIFFKLGFDINGLRYEPLTVWLVSMSAILAFLALVSYLARRYFGDFQIFLARLCFIIYCLCNLRWPYWPFVAAALVCIIGMEYLKYKDNPKTMFKKDPRF